MRHVKDIMSTPVASTSENSTIQDAARLMAEKNIGSLAVVEGDKIIGILTERDISKKIVAENRNPSQVKVAEIMNRNIITTPPDTTVDEAASIIAERHFRRLPIVDDGRLVGMITQTDIEIALRDEAINESKARLRDHYKFEEQIREKEQKIEDMEDKINGK